MFAGRNGQNSVLGIQGIVRDKNITVLNGFEICCRTDKMDLY